jgi:ferrous iron transport protein B
MDILKTFNKTSSASEAKANHATKPPVFAFVGQPNSGKSTLFNALTGMRQKVGNYPGVTVECKSGTAFNMHGKPVTLIDLPGAYSLSSDAPDSLVLIKSIGACEAVEHSPDCLLIVADATQLDRHLYFVTQIIELGIPAVLVLNMMDVVRKRGLKIDTKLLSEILGIPVVGCQANQIKGIFEIKQVLAQPIPKPSAWRLDSTKKWSELIEKRFRNAVDAERLELEIAKREQSMRHHAHHLNHHRLQSTLSVLYSEEIPTKEAEERVHERYNVVKEMCQEVVRRESDDLYVKTVTDRIDSVLLHRTWGWLGLVAIMGVFFYAIFAIAEYPKGWLEDLIQTTSGLLHSVLPHGSLKDLLIEGVFAGVGSVFVFLPQILILYFLIGILEETGYMSRAAFILDKLMSRVGLSGQSFIPFLSSYACAIPGILSTRIINNPQERLATILVAPFASCSARLPMYTLMISLMVPAGKYAALMKTGLMLGAYALGTVGAYVSAYIFRKTLCKGASGVHVHEMPEYRLPIWRRLGGEMMHRALLFVKKAGTVILGFSIILWVGLNYPKAPEHYTASQAIESSYIGCAGKWMEPVIRPMGYDWRVGVGLLASFAARETFISTMAIVYSTDVENPEENNRLTPTLQAVTHAGSDQTFYTPLMCLSLIVFYVFAMQCMSTVAVVYKETCSWKWPLFQLVYMTGLAYVGAFLVYQIGRLLGYA